jgi:glycosyltransferase involved in cell wall biosynthesis
MTFPPGRGLLLISPSDYDSALAKGVAPLLDDFHEDGFFARVVICFPLTRHARRVRLTERTEILECGVPVARRWLRRLLAPLHVARSVLRLARLVRDERIDAVRATDPCFSGLLALAIARLARRPVCVSIHADYDKRHALAGDAGAPVLLGSRRLASLVEGFVLSRVDAVWPIRETLVAYALARGAARERITVIPHGADLGLFVSGDGATPPDGLPAGRLVVSFAGRLSRENYVDDLLSIARRLGSQRRDFVLVIAGSGDEEARLATTLAADPILRDVVRMVGSLDRPAVAGLRRASLVALVLMGGFSLIEAAAAGAALVSYDVEWHREIVRDGESGRLLTEHDVDGVVAAVAAFLDDPANARAMGHRAQTLALARHRLDAATRHKQRCYAALLAHG